MKELFSVRGASRRDSYSLSYCEIPLCLPFPLTRQEGGPNSDMAAWLSPLAVLLRKDASARGPDYREE